LTEIEQRINRQLVADPLAQDFGIAKKVISRLPSIDSGEVSSSDVKPVVEEKKRSLNPMRRKISARRRR
jgi:hypothetical protein